MLTTIWRGSFAAPGLFGGGVFGGGGGEGVFFLWGGGGVRAGDGSGHGNGAGHTKAARQPLQAASGGPALFAAPAFGGSCRHGGRAGAVPWEPPPICDFSPVVCMLRSAAPANPTWNPP